ncbi:MAG: ABC transporter permease [Methanomassiliicoccaceae archaeon]|nr:ABC transporter permease [Methanomassiliicoccaceae archaeon]
MNDLLNLVKKELRELMTIESAISIVVVMVLFVGLGFMISDQTEQAMEPVRMGIINYDDQGSSTYYDTVNSTLDEMYDPATRDQYLIKLYPSTILSDDKIISLMKDNGLSNLLIVDPYFSEDIDSGIQGKIEAYYITVNSGAFGGIDSDSVQGFVSVISGAVSTKLMENELSVDPAESAFLKSPVSFNMPDNHTYVNGKLYSDITPSAISGAMMSQTLMVPIIIMIVIMVVGSIVISSMGTEKENKTLETLLTLPVKRTTIVSGKILASGIMGLVYGAAYMVGMYAYMNAMTASAGSVNLADYGLVLEPIDWAITMLVMFASILCALGLCMIMGAFVKNYKSAQTMTLPISVLAMIPMFVFMFVGWNTLPAAMQAIMFIIPFSHPMMVMQNLMFGDYLLVFGGLIYCIAFAAVTVLITVRLYNSDILLVGFGQTRLGRILAKFKKAD